MTVPLRRVDRLRGSPRRSDLPDFVDLEEMIARLSVTPDTIARLRNRRRFPEAHRHFHSQELWWWPHIALWTRQRGGSTRKPRPLDVIPVVDLVGLREIATRLEVPVRVVNYWKQSDRLPDPDYRWSESYAWIWETIVAWTEAANRRRSETPLWGRLLTKVAEARALVATGTPTIQLRRLIEEVAADEAALLGTSSLAYPELSNAEFLARFDAIRDRLDELAHELEAVEGGSPEESG